jgi:hypothetical protein
MIRSLTRSVGANLDAKAVAEEVLSQPLELSERPASVRADTWHRLRRSALEPQVRRSPMRWRWIGAAGALAGLVAVVFAIEGGLRPNGAPSAPVVARHDWPDGWIEVDLGVVGRLFVAPEASFRLPEPTPLPESEYVVDLDRGVLCAEVSHRDPALQGPFIVQSAALRATAVGTRFCVLAGVSPDDSWVMVEEGRVRVERMGEPTMLAGIGSLVRGRDHPRALDPPQPARAERPSAARVASECLSSRSKVAEENCLWRRAGRADLGAQNALYLLGALARDEDHDGPAALSIWQTYLQRFPRGALVAETRWAMFDELVDERRYPEAIRMSEDFLREAPTYFRLGELETRRGDLLAGTLDRPSDAEQAYRHALAIESRPFLREKALFSLGSCQEKLGEAAEARATWELYLREFPQGIHAGEVESRLAAPIDH